MADRYFSESPISGSHARLEGAEAHHLAHVMRAKAGDEVTLFDGTGAEFAARVENVGRSSVKIAVLSRREVDRELARRIVLAVSLPKGDRQRWLVEKATELGVARLVPLLTTRGAAQPVEAALVRLRRAVIEAAKQCGRNRLMEIAAPTTFDEYIKSAPANATRWIAHPANTNFATCHPQPPALPEGELPAGPRQTTMAPGQSPGLRVKEISLTKNERKSREVIFAIGPEGGFTDEEVQAALDARWQPLNLGPGILRVETAAIAVAAWAALACPEPQS